MDENDLDNTTEIEDRRSKKAMAETGVSMSSQCTFTVLYPARGPR